MTVFHPDLTTAFAGSACIGAWAHNPQTDRIALSPALARLLALPEAAASGAPLRLALARIEPEDALRLESVLRAAGEDGCPFEAEFRIRGGPAGARWLRLMGRCARDPASGALATQGLAFDLTEGRADGPADRLAQRRANRLADHAVAMKGLVAELRNPPLARLVDEVAVEVGHEVARRLRGGGGPVH
jgi:PAS domain-containing protein